ncbi:MAG: hypothetical protein A3F82_07960 [Deltaproteobacteria bacterium RIFCSPLOWO2_12_FULL_44_12]|nr:MAG: hypothetical protein A2712_07310 [Deltaproteobacteria bacterium RIFCSPHIGHO2_01_FULL_43_49]OGQ15752.1 MAG: hypothetical protein A3D22_06100 [Deltaproteobacteria bacterium RIFCSPHIGHO2_02_FULL_44_53]OGQ28721.1 MAG: hypothetical protein A3D98_00835 [Deltaproteobacteria bacterium RIFCSPHIGHO2_12_FULL_44_21]OGQ32045.1 MAG: hypothetical protein A2979_03045 [Deltaproteobacteria bacterium RIFCSPLOWO2_01_FULL_45_74]OGQ43656.1 MAG: hypothetical protein A3I70_03560 [Deltaproteobacteria bacterium 
MTISTLFSGPGVYAGSGLIALTTGFASEVGRLSFESEESRSNEAYNYADGLRRVIEGRDRTGDIMNLNFHFDNDAHIDDLAAFVVLWSAVGDRLLSATVSNGDSILASALETYRRLFKLLDIKHMKLGAAQKNVRNSFPMAWRKTSDEVNGIELISKTDASSQQTKPDSSIEVLRECVQKGPVRLVTTGPLTNIAEWFQSRPEDRDKIHSLVIMGGALNVAGNVPVSETSDGTTEWNFFADPAAAEVVLSSGLPILLIPLDVAGQIPVSDDFIRLLSQEKLIKSQLVHQLWDIVYRRYDYFLWDVVAAVAAVNPELFTFEEHRLSVVQEGRAQGRLMAIGDGPLCQVAIQLDKAAVLARVMDLLSKG